MLTLEVKFYLNQTAQNIIEVGKRLNQAKELVPHGEWQNWLRDNFQLSYATAARFIQCAERFGNVATLRDLKYSQMLQLITLPTAEEIERFIEAKAAEGKPVLLAEARLGELFSQLPKTQGARTDLVQPIDTPVEKLESVSTVKPKSEVIKELGLNQKQAERLADNPDAVQKVIRRWQAGTVQVATA